MLLVTRTSSWNRCGKNTEKHLYFHHFIAIWLFCVMINHYTFSTFKQIHIPGFDMKAKYRKALMLSPYYWLATYPFPVIIKLWYNGEINIMVKVCCAFLYFNLFKKLATSFYVWHVLIKAYNESIFKDKNGHLWTFVDI